MKLSDDPTLGECLAVDNAKKLAALNRAAESVAIVPPDTVCVAQTFTDSDMLADAHRIELVRYIEAGERARDELSKLGVTRAAQTEADALGISLSVNANPPARLLRGTQPVRPFWRELVLLETFVAGFQHHAGMKQEVFVTLAPGMRLDLKREPENPHDRNAIALHVPAGHCIGFIPRKQNKLLASAMDQGISLTVHIDAVDPEKEPYSRVAISVLTSVPIINRVMKFSELGDL